MRTTTAALLVLPLVASALDAQARPPAAELLHPGRWSTAANEYNPSLAADGSTMVFARSDADFRNARILVARRVDGTWTEPEPAAFTDARWSDSDPTFAPDGRTLYFASDRPAPGRDSARTDLDLWRVRREGDRWGAPEHLGDAVNGPGMELGPAWHDGWLYFSSTRGGRARMLDIYRAREQGTGFAPAEPIEAWNTPASESDVELSPDGSLVLFWSDRPGARGGADVFASRRTPEGWSEARALAGPINSDGFDFTPSFTPDGCWILFASTRAAGVERDPPVGQSNLYRVPLRGALPD